MARFRDWSFEDAPPHVVGIVTVLLGGTLVGAAFLFGVFGAFEDRYEVTAVFEQAGGLRTGADVVIAGVAVGEVRELDPDWETGQVVVTFRVDDEIALSENTRAEIRLGTLFGGFGVRLRDPGGEQLLADLAPADRRIGLDRTDVPDGVVEALDASTEAIGDLDVEAVNRVAGQIATVLEGTREDLPELFTELGDLGDILDRRSTELERLVVDGQVLVEAIASQEDDLVELTDAATVLLDDIAASRDELAALVGEGNEGVVALTALLRDNRAELERLTDTVHDAMGRTVQQRAAVNEALNLLGPSVEQFNDAFKGDFVDLYSDLPIEALLLSVSPVAAADGPDRGAYR